jgi:hypothetical protein
MRPKLIALALLASGCGFHYAVTPDGALEIAINQPRMIPGMASETKTLGVGLKATDPTTSAGVVLGLWGTLTRYMPAGETYVSSGRLSVLGVSMDATCAHGAAALGTKEAVAKRIVDALFPEGAP